MFKLFFPSTSYWNLCFLVCFYCLIGKPHIDVSKSPNLNNLLWTDFVVFFGGISSVHSTIYFFLKHINNRKVMDNAFYFFIIVSFITDSICLEKKLPIVYVDSYFIMHGQVRPIHDSFVIHSSWKFKSNYFIFRLFPNGPKN